MLIEIESLGKRDKEDDEDVEDDEEDDDDEADDDDETDEAEYSVFICVDLEVS